MTLHENLAPVELPAPAEWSDWLSRRTTDALDRVRAVAAELKAPRRQHASDILRQWNELSLRDVERRRVNSRAQPGPPGGRRPTTGREFEQEADKLATDLSLDRDLYDVLAVDRRRRLDPLGSACFG